MILYKYMKAMVHSNDNDFFDIVMRILQGDTLAFLFIIYQDYVLQILIDLPSWLCLKNMLRTSL